LGKKYFMFASLILLFCGTAKAALPVGNLLDGVRPGPDGKIDVLTIFAHEDDETIEPGGTLIKLKKDPRVRLHILCLSKGEKSEAKFFLNIGEDHQASIRRRELISAATVLGADDVTHWDYADHDLNQADQAELLKRVMAVIEKTTPEIIITHDPAGITRNPDHICCSAVATKAFKQSQAQKLYYTTLPKSLYMLAGFTTQFHTRGVNPAWPTMKVDVSEELRLKKLAIYEHATQRHYTFVAISMAQAEHMKWEYFALAESK
jgi:LmbE family N-acetylglucosaminyl deacetylase